MTKTYLLGLLASSAMALGGCVLEPPAANAERDRLARAAPPYAAPFEARSLPDLPTQPDWPDVLRRALLANGELEAAYLDWKSAMAGIQIAGQWPNADVALGYQYLFTRESVKGWNQNTLITAFDPSMNVQLPTKVAQAAKVAYQEVRAKAERFRAAKFDLQRKVLLAYHDWAMLAEKARILRENAALLKVVADLADQRVRAGGAQRDLLKAQTEHEMALSDLADVETDLATARAGLNALMARRPNEPLNPPDRLPAPRKIAPDDTRLLAEAMGGNAELAALAEDVAARRQAAELARLGYLPDFTASFSLTGDIEKNLLGMVMLPTTWHRIQGQIDQAAAAEDQAQAMLRQTRCGRWSEFATALYGLRNAERQVALFRQSILPKARQAWETTAQSYAAGLVGLTDVLDTQRTLLTVRLAIAQAQTTREKKLAELEALAGVDIEGLSRPTTAPATQPASQSASQPAGGGGPSSQPAEATSAASRPSGGAPTTQAAS